MRPGAVTVAISLPLETIGAVVQPAMARVRNILECVVEWMVIREVLRMGDAAPVAARGAIA